MFTGIIEEIGVARSVRRTGGGIRLEISAPNSVRELMINDSVALNGVCQTVVAKSKTTFSSVAVEETLKKTTLRSLGAGDRVNIELPVRFNDRMGGHLVLGHVDAVGRIKNIQKKKSSWLVGISFPAGFTKYVIPEGSIAVDGVSLTIASHSADELVVSIIPHTMDKTIFPFYGPGSAVNLEFDVVGKYIERMSILKNPVKTKSGGISVNELQTLGY